MWQRSGSHVDYVKDLLYTGNKALACVLDWGLKTRCKLVMVDLLLHQLD